MPNGVTVASPAQDYRSIAGFCQPCIWPYGWLRIRQQFQSKKPQNQILQQKMFSASWSQPSSSPPMSSSRLQLELAGFCPLTCLEALSPSLCSFQGINTFSTPWGTVWVSPSLVASPWHVLIPLLNDKESGGCEPAIILGMSFRNYLKIF